MSVLSPMAITEEPLTQNVTSAANSTPNSNPAPNPPKTHFDILKEELASGKIPQGLSEEMRLVPFESDAGQRFHEVMLEFIKPFYSGRGKDIRYGTHDFDKEPVKFILSKSGTANGCRIKYTDPSTVVIDAALFEAQGTHEALIENNADLAYFLIHEISHGKLRKEFGEDVKNSKFEEGAFYSIPIQLLHANGINPELGLRTAEKLANLVSRETKNAQLYTLLLDEHPLPQNIIKIASDTHAYILRKSGKHDYKDYELSINSSILNPIKEGIRHDYLASRIAAINDFESLKASQKIKTLGEILGTMQNYYPVRIYDLIAELKKIKDTPDAEIKKAASGFVDQILNIVTQTEVSVPIEILLLRISRLANPTVHELEPMGRLKAINDRAKELIQANNDLLNIFPKTSEWKVGATALIEAATNFNKAVEAEPLAQTHKGRDFLRMFNWSQFEFPDSDEIERLNQRKIKHGISIPDDKYPKISWSPMRYLARGNVEILKAGFLMGLNDDPGMYEAIRFHDAQVGLDFYSGDFSSHQALHPSLKFTPISKGPIDEAHMGIADIVINSSRSSSNSYCVDFTDFTSTENLIDSKSNISLPLTNAHNANINYLITTLNLNTQVGEEEALRLAEKFVGNNMDFNSPEYSLSNFSFFLKANKATLCLPEKYAIIASNFIEVLKQLIQENGAEGVKTVKQFHGLENGDQSFWQTLIGYQFHSDQEWVTQSIAAIDKEYKQTSVTDTEEEDKESPDSETPILRELKSNPFIKFFLNDEQNIFSIDEKKTILDSIKYFPTYPNDPTKKDNVTLNALYSISDKTEAAKTLEYFSIYFPDINKLKTLEQTLNFLRQPNLGAFDTYIGELKLLTLACKKNDLSLDTSFAIIEVAKKSAINKSPDLKKSLEASVNKNFNQVIHKSNLNKAIKYWVEFTKNDLFKAGQSTEYLVSILEFIKQEDPENIKMYCQTLLSSNQIKSPKQRETITELWSNSILVIEGQDTGKQDYFSHAKANVDWVLGEVNRTQQRQLLQILLSKMQAQHSLCKYTEAEFDKQSIREKDFDHLNEAGIVTESLLTYLENNPEKKEPLLDFLIKPHSLNSSDNLIKEFANIFIEKELKSQRIFLRYDESNDGFLREEFVKTYDNDFNKINHEDLAEHCPELTNVKRFFGTVKEKARIESKELYDNFWAAPLFIRAVLIRELLLSNKHDQDAIFDKAIKTMIKAETDEANEIRVLLKKYILALHKSQKNLALSAMMVASARTEEELRIGQSLALFAENMGPAETKLGQCAESHPKVRVDIRKDLKRLKFSADEPYRWLVLKQIEELNNQILDSYNLKADKTNVQDLDSHGRIYIKKVGDVLGSGSLFVAVEVEMSDGTQRVIAIKRPDARERARYGFDTFAKMLDDLQPGKIKNTLSELIHNAQVKLDIEVDCLIADEQYSIANKLYKDAFIVVNGRKIYFESPLISASGGGFYMMDKIEGEHFAEAEIDSQITDSVKKDASMALLIMELHNIFNGQFCNDRHGGNTKARPLDESSLMVGHIDFKALAIKQWPQVGYDQFAEILVQMVSQINQIKSADDFVNILLDIQSSIRDQGKSIDPFVSEVQKALLSNSEYARNLNSMDLQKVLLSALANGVNTQMRSAIQKQIPNIANSSVKSFISKFIETGRIEIPFFTPIRIQRAT